MRLILLGLGLSTVIVLGSCDQRTPTSATEPRVAAPVFSTTAADCEDVLYINVAERTVICYWLRRAVDVLALSEDPGCRAAGQALEARLETMSSFNRKIRFIESLTGGVHSTVIGTTEGNRRYATDDDIYVSRLFVNSLSGPGTEESKLRYVTTIAAHEMIHTTENTGSSEIWSHGHFSSDPYATVLHPPLHWVFGNRPLAGSGVDDAIDAFGEACGKNLDVPL